jgi:hypothetical protein
VGGVEKIGALGGMCLEREPQSIVAAKVLLPSVEMGLKGLRFLHKLSLDDSSEPIDALGVLAVEAFPHFAPKDKSEHEKRSEDENSCRKKRPVAQFHGSSLLSIHPA